jgi:hypothetical protein
VDEAEATIAKKRDDLTVRGAIDIGRVLLTLMHNVSLYATATGATMGSDVARRRGC